MIAALLALAVSAEPAHLRLGLDARASIAIDCARVPEIAASDGSVDELQHEGARWTAVYRPPRGAIPRVALVAVFCGDEPALLPIPLWGDGDAEVHARPRAVVSVRIGDESFGPLRTDANGVARVPVVVPPGVDFAQQGPRRIDLRVPRTRTVLLVARQGELAVDRKRDLPLWVFAVDRAGAPLPDAPLQLSAAGGVLGAPQQIAPGVSRVEWSFEAGAPGQATAQATVPGDPEPSVVALKLIAGAPAAIELSAERRELNAGEGPVRLHAEVRDAAGNILDARLVARASIGALRVAGHDLEVQVPAVFEGERELRVSVQAGAARAEMAIALHPASPAVVRIVAARKVLADGRSAVRVRLRALDRFGNEVQVPPAATADVGSVKQSGWDATFVPPLLHDRATALLQAQTGEAAASARIELDPAVRPLAVAVRGGFFSNLHEVFAPTAGIVASARTDLLDSQIGLQVSFDALGWRTTDQVATSAGVVRGARTSLGVGVPAAAVELRRALSDRSTAWVLAGPALAIASSSTNVDGASGVRDRGASFGAQVGGGAEMRVWRGRALFELRWLAVRSFSLDNLSGPLSGLCATAGYRVELF